MSDIFDNHGKFERQTMATIEGIEASGVAALYAAAAAAPDDEFEEAKAAADRAATMWRKAHKARQEEEP